MASILIKNTSAVEVHGIPAGETQSVKASPDGKALEALHHRKRIADGTFQIVKAEKPPAAAPKFKAKQEG
jgi:hypothetical protein